MDNRHNIVYITDSGYFFPTKVSIRSAIRNSEDHDITIFVIASELNDSEISALEKMQTDNAVVRVLSVTNNLINDALDHHYVSRTALLKFKLAEILEDLDKVLYIDGDTLLFPGYLSIFDYNIEKYYMGAIKDICTQTWLKRSEYIGNESYFNSGVMLLNLKKIREDNCVDKLIKYKKEDSDNTFMDQDAINKIFGRETLSISPTYNFLAPIINNFSISEFANFYGLDETASENIYSNPLILHMAGVEKPWDNALSDCIDKWFEFLYENEKREVIDNFFVKGALRKKVKDLEKKELNFEIYKNKLQELDTILNKRTADNESMIIVLKNNLNELSKDNESMIKVLKNNLNELSNLESICEKRIDSNQEYIIKLLNNTKDLQNQITDLNHKLNYYKNRTLFGAIKRIKEKIRGK